MITIPMTEQQEQACAAYAFNVGCETWRVAVAAIDFRDRVNARKAAKENND